MRKSVRTVQKMAKEGVLRWKSAHNPKSPAARLYDPADVQRYAPAAPKPRPARSHHRRELALTGDGKLTRDLLARFEKSLDTNSIVGQLVALIKAGQDAEQERRKADREDERERWESEQKLRKLEENRALRWLTLEEAAAVTNLPKAYLLRAIEKEKLDAIKAGSWRIRRASLEAFEG